MRISGFGWAAVGTDDFSSTVRFFNEVLGLPLESCDNAQEAAEFRLPSGQGFGVVGRRTELQRLHQCPLVGFDVEDVRSARRELAAKGVEFVSEVFEAGGETWTYFRGPDGHLYEIWDRQEAQPSP